MTSNQIAYWNLQETKRSNAANEKIKEDTLGETKRANLSKEVAEGYKLVETERHNKSTEKLNALDSARDYEVGLEQARNSLINNSTSTTGNVLGSIIKGLLGR